MAQVIGKLPFLLGVNSKIVVFPAVRRSTLVVNEGIVILPMHP